MATNDSDEGADGNSLPGTGEGPASESIEEETSSTVSDDAAGSDSNVTPGATSESDPDADSAAGIDEDVDEDTDENTDADSAAIDPDTDIQSDSDSDTEDDAEDEGDLLPPVTVGRYGWEAFKREYYYDEEGNPPEEGKPPEVVPFDPESYLGFDPAETEPRLESGATASELLAEIEDERTVRVDPHLDEDEFFSNADGTTTVVTRYDLEKAVPSEKKGHFREVDRYWVHKPYAFVVIFHSEKENEKKYCLVDPYLTDIESELREFLVGKLKTAIKYSDDDVVVQGDSDARAEVIETETHTLLERYGLYAEEARPDSGGLLDSARDLVGFGCEEEDAEDGPQELQGISVRPEPALIEEDSPTLTEHQIEKLFYYLTRDFVGFERIDGIKHDINVEDISCDGYNSPVFVYHSEYEQIISNVYHGEDELDEFVVKLAQRSGKGISKRSPQVDATLPDGSRAQLTLGREVSDHGTNYTIRQFKDVPFTPIDLINWNTFSLDEMAFLWLCIENQKSVVFAGGTASGKTTSLNAVSLFIPSKAKIVSIEDTREVELPQRNWIASVTRPSFSDDDKGDVDEFDLLEAALRQRPEYIVMGEIRGEEGRTLFQVMSTGHTTLTTFHADSVGEVIKRFTTEPINVSKTMFTALDLVSIQTQTRVQDDKVRRNKSLTEINHYDPENDEINVQDVYQWQAETDEYLKMGQSNTLDGIAFDRGWRYDRLESELLVREIVLAYLIHEGLNTYTQVAATLQAFLNDPETILTLIATDDLERSLEDLREMESVEIDIDPDKEAMVPRPDASEEMLEETKRILERADPVLEEYRGPEPGVDIVDALDIDAVDDIEVGGFGDDRSESDDDGFESGAESDLRTEFDLDSGLGAESDIDAGSDTNSNPGSPFGAGSESADGSDIPNLDDLRSGGDDDTDP
ncbi:MAG: type II/IV secretion system ATPase subunit [Natronomonas sp.]|uniref:type II/IV secretion system ATPase subunit n=1 Tax=Natronomonas sp. TaxID=2184060 RepID=UPI0028709F5D|nr:type II/IV secretion system ATPase subunit [Natronomonas sp.]MDR9429521.1 type II/IV secretion system ATPase subunit [Natronomonas sp.]